MDMVKSNWIVINVLIFCVYKSDASQQKETKTVEFYDDNNNLHIINLAVPEITEIFFHLIRPRQDDARFWLYTRKNPNNYEELNIDNLSNVIYFNPVNPLIVVTHGWTNTGLSNSTQLIKDAYLDTRDVNVIVVDWEKDAGYKNYFWSAHATTLIAKQIRDMILALSRQYKLYGEDMHFIGHSLGAHVVGVAGIKLRRETFVIGRVTGLDPARPFFEFPKKIPPITKKSASFVDIIHTNAGVLGYKSSIGHADFYPNGGNKQPHCCQNWKLGKSVSCAHACSYIYFQEAIRGIIYLSTQCHSYSAYLKGSCQKNDKQLMGIPKTTARGFCKSDARQNEQAEVVEYYDDNNNLHLIDLEVPDMTEIIMFLSLPRQDDARFWLYTRKNKDNYEELNIENLSNVTYFNPDNPLIVVTHGWLNSGLSRSTQWIKDAYLDTRDFNVIVVDWEKDAAYKCYFWSAYSTTLIAKQIRSMVLALSRKYNLFGADMHFIGHSLGAHVAGLAGIRLRRQEFIIGRVTGLDPARPFFEFPQIFPAITKKSASFVDIIHTNVGVLGYISSIGHADFYPNGGYYQPHCCHNLNFVSCGHLCSYIYFQEAIRGIAYLSTRCDSYFEYLIGICDNNDMQLMGLSTTARGSYFLSKKC